MTDASPLSPARAAPLPAGGVPILLRALFKRAGTAGEAAFALPATTYDMAPPGAAALAGYNALLGYAAGAVPLSFFYLSTQRAHLGTLLAPQFPFRVVGMVHVENAMRAYRPLAAGRALRLVTQAGVEAPTSSGARLVRLETTAFDGEEPVFSCSSTYLAQAGSGRRKGAPETAPPSGAVIGGWHVGHAAGRTYARVSGDWNPIHLARWPARLLDMPAAIIHGMDSVGRIGAAFEAGAERVSAITARFRAPVPLGTRVTLVAGEAPGSFVLLAYGRPAVEGSVETASRD